MPAPTVAIIGAGIGGLTAGIYAQRSGLRSQIYEMHALPGGLMTGWTRNRYTIENCIHSLIGAGQQSGYRRFWEEMGVLPDRPLFEPEVFMRYEARDGRSLNVYCDPDRLEQELLKISPSDAGLIRQLCGGARKLAGFEPPADMPEGFFQKLPVVLPLMKKLLPVLPLLVSLARLNIRTFAARFRDPFLREALTYFLALPEAPAFGLLMALGLMQPGSVYYPIGGSLPIARAIEQRYLALGGQIHYQSRVIRILTEPMGDGNLCRASGIVLADKSKQTADYVVSAADGHTTLFEMLDSRFLTPQVRRIYQEFPLFSSLVMVGVGVRRTFPDLPCTPGGTTWALPSPLLVAGKRIERVVLIVYNFDPSLSPPGTTVLKAAIPSEYETWAALGKDQARYTAEKERIGRDFVSLLDQRFPGLAAQVDMIDVATPLTYIRYTGNWRGAMEGFLPGIKTMLTPVPKTLPGLEHFSMAGQWVSPGGGLQSGLLTGRDAIRRICKAERLPFE